MLNKNDPLISAVQQVMQQSNAEREAVKVVNEYFGIEDRKALPHEYQGQWDAAYQQVLSEGVEALDESIAAQLAGTAAGLGLSAAGIYSGAIPKAFEKAASILKKMKKKKKEKKEQVDEDSSLAGLAPPYSKTTRKDVLVGRGVLKKHPTQPHKHVLAKEEDELEEGVNVPSVSYNKTTTPGGTYRTIMTKRTNNPFSRGTTMLHQTYKSADGNSKLTDKITSKDLGANKKLGGRDYEVSASSSYANKMNESDKTEADVTSPSSLGIKKPNYAPAGTTPDYAKPKTQTVNRSAKTSLPPGTMKEEKENKFAKVMREFKKRKLHSGSKHGPVVTDPQQAKAIAASEAGIARKK